MLWFGTSSSLIRFEPAASDRPPVPPPIRITGLRIMDVQQSVSALGERDLSLPDLAPDQHRLQIDFSALSFAPGEVLRYQYQLDGVGGGWSAPSDQRSVTYASLSPGRHTFRVRAVNSDGALSTDAASVTFTVLRPLWLRWWFLTLEVSALLALVYGVYRYRVARVLELAAIRTRIATDLHDDIGANLTRIAVLSEVAKQTPGDVQLASIAGIARESVSAMSDIVWAINPKRESVADLIRRMRQHAEEVFTLRDIELRFNADGAHDSSRLGIDVRRELLLTFKEAVNNAARHSQCSQGVDRPAPRRIASASVGRRRWRGVRHIAREPGPGTGESAPARRTPQGHVCRPVRTRRGHDGHASRPPVIARQAPTTTHPTHSGR